MTRLPAPARPAVTLGARIAAASLVCGAAILLFAVHTRPLGYVPLVAGVALGLAADRRLGRDLALIAAGEAIISTISLRADLSNAGMTRFAVVLSLAVLVPWAASRFVFGDHRIVFPRGRTAWSRVQWAYLLVVVTFGYLVLPMYFIGSGAYQNWPHVTEPGEIARLFAGVNAVGLWDELFFICVVFALLRAHFPTALANVMQACVFVSFLWELGYQSWGPALTIPFALIQGAIFAWTKSLPYVVTVHLLFDAVVFGVLVHAHNPHLLDVFVTAPTVGA